MSEEQPPIPENYALPALLMVFNFIVILSVAMTSMSHTATLWDIIFVLAGVYCTNKFIKYVVQAHDHKQTRMTPQNVDEFVTKGVYARVRRPIAAGVLYMNIAYVFLFRTLALIPVLPVFFAMWYALSRYEENILLEQFGPQYQTYMSQTGLFRSKGDSASTRLSDTGYEI